MLTFRKKNIAPPLIWGLLLGLLSGCLSAPRQDAAELSIPSDFEYRSEITMPEAKSTFAYGQYRLFATEGRWSEALEALERAVAFDPDSIYLRMSLARAYLHIKQPDRSISVLKELLATHPDYVEGHILIGDLLLNNDQPEAAAEHYRQALELDGERDSLQLKLALALAGQGEREAAIAEILALLQQKPEYTSAQLALARIYKEDLQFSQAAKVYRQILSRKPQQVEILLELGQMLEDQRQPEEALTLYREGLQESPRSIALRDQMARLLIAENRYSEALFLLQELNEIHPNRVQVLGRIGLLQLEMQGWAEAELTFRKILRLEPGHQRSHYYLGMALSGGGNVQAALDELALVEPEAEVYLDAVTQRAFLLQKNDRPLQAIELLEEVLDKGWNEPILYYYLSSAYFSLDQWGQAEETLRTGLQDHPDNLNLRYQLGMVLEKMERREEARALMLQILDADPEYADALNYLAYVKAETGEDLEQALIEAQRALELKPAGYIMDTLGWVYYKLGRYEESRQYLEGALESHGDDPVIIEHLADLYRALGLWARAAELYRQALELDPFAEGVKEKLDALPEGSTQ